MIQATQLRPGMIIDFKGDLHSVFKTEHRTPGNKRGFVQARLRNLRSGALIDHKFSSTDTVDRAFMDEKAMEYLYDDGENYCFMDTEDYSQVELPGELLGDLMVRLPSASGEGAEPARRIHFSGGSVFPGMSHIHIANHPDVYEALRDLLAFSPD